MYKALIVVLASYWRDWSVRVRCCVHLSAEACTTDVPAVQLMLHELQSLHGWLQVRLYQQLYQLVIKCLAVDSAAALAPPAPLKQQIFETADILEPDDLGRLGLQGGS
jgi:hypothetical protein